MLDEVKEEFHGYDMAPVTRENFSQVFPVYASNQEFFLLTQGKKAIIENSINDIEALPPHCKKEQKHYVSIKKNGSVIGVCDFIETCPEQTSFGIGLLLIHRDLHNQTIGSNLVSALLRAAKKRIPVGAIRRDREPYKRTAVLAETGVSPPQKQGNHSCDGTSHFMIAMRIFHLEERVTPTPERPPLKSAFPIYLMM